MEVAKGGIEVSEKCIDCKNRYVGCHDNCKNYLEYKEMSEKARMGRREDFAYKDYIANRLWREKK